MEQSSGPENTGSVAPTYVRPPGVEFAMGVALFAVTLVVFNTVQSGVFVQGVLDRSPEFEGHGSSFRLLSDPGFQVRVKEFSANGDILSRAALWSGLAGLFMILGTVALWKRQNTKLFLGLHMASARQFLVWMGVFLLLGFGIEALSRFSPAFHTDFMDRMLSSTTDLFWLVLGVGIMAPLFEEFLLRGLLFGSLRYMVDEHAAVALTAGVFALMHLQYEWTIMLLIVPIGVVLGYARSRSGSIWVPVLLHILNNTASIFLG
jgi:membrane protease YdiL (CAAX protease family)